MRLVLGLACVVAGVVWLFAMGRRRRHPVPPGQALFDFLTGAPIESVLSIGLVLFGVILILAQLLGAG